VYAGLPFVAVEHRPARPLSRSRSVVLRLAALFCALKLVYDLMLLAQFRMVAPEDDSGP
jgi:hypothetical protein